jgi:hypothetical protein
MCRHFSLQFPLFTCLPVFPHSPCLSTESVRTNLWQPFTVAFCSSFRAPKMTAKSRTALYEYNQVHFKPWRCRFNSAQPFETQHGYTITQTHGNDTITQTHRGTTQLHKHTRDRHNYTNTHGNDTITQTHGNDTITQTHRGTTQLHKHTGERHNYTNTRERHNYTNTRERHNYTNTRERHNYTNTTQQKKATWESMLTQQPN